MKTLYGDIFDVTKGVIVHGCNARGKMNSGVAKQVREKYPLAYDMYMKYYKSGVLKVGMIIPVQVTADLVIINAITQDDYGYDGLKRVSYDAIDSCFKKIAFRYYDDDIDIYVPSIGAGLAGGDWSIISNIITQTMTKCAGKCNVSHYINDSSTFAPPSIEYENP